MLLFPHTAQVDIDDLEDEDEDESDEQDQEDQEEDREDLDTAQSAVFSSNTPAVEPIDVSHAHTPHPHA